VLASLTPHRQLLAKKLLRNFPALPTHHPSIQDSENAVRLGSFQNAELQRTEFFESTNQ